MLTVLKSGSLNLLEPSGPVQGCTGIAEPLHFTTLNVYITSLNNGIAAQHSHKYSTMALHTHTHTHNTHTHTHTHIQFFALQRHLELSNKAHSSVKSKQGTAVLLLGGQRYKLQGSNFLVANFVTNSTLHVGRTMTVDFGYMIK